MIGKQNGGSNVKSAGELNCDDVNDDIHTRGMIIGGGGNGIGTLTCSLSVLITCSHRVQRYTSRTNPTDS